MSTESKTFVAAPDHLPAILDWVNSHIQRSSLPSKEKKQVELALEEAIVNVVHHSKSDNQLQLSVLVRFVGDDQIEFELMDNGSSFNPLTHTSYEIDLPLEEREPGGLGLMLMKKCMDSITYRYENQCNILTLIKNLR